MSFKLARLCLKKKKSNLHILYFLWLGSVINQVFHPVMFDKCIQILKKSWPQESNLSQKRKKEHPRSSKNNHRRGRKRGKPPRKEDDQVRRHFQAGLGGDTLALFTWWVQDCQDCIQTVNAPTWRSYRDCSMQSSADHSGLGNLEQHRDLGKVRSSYEPSDGRLALTSCGQMKPWDKHVRHHRHLYIFYDPGGWIFRRGRRGGRGDLFFCLGPLSYTKCHI